MLINRMAIKAMVDSCHVDSEFELKTGYEVARRCELVLLIDPDMAEVFVKWKREGNGCVAISSIVDAVVQDKP